MTSWRVGWHCFPGALPHSIPLPHCIPPLGLCPIAFHSKWIQGGVQLGLLLSTRPSFQRNEASWFALFVRSHCQISVLFFRVANYGSGSSWRFWGRNLGNRAWGRKRVSWDIIPYSPLSKSAILSRTDFCHLEISHDSRRSPETTWMLAALGPSCCLLKELLSGKDLEAGVVEGRSF